MGLHIWQPPLCSHQSPILDCEDRWRGNPVQRGLWTSRFQWHMQTLRWDPSWRVLIWDHSFVCSTRLHLPQPPPPLGVGLTWPIHHLSLAAPSFAQALHQHQTLRQGSGEESISGWDTNVVCSHYSSVTFHVTSSSVVVQFYCRCRIYLNYNPVF